MFAAGIFAAMTLFFGSTIKDPGAVPKLHIIIAPETTWKPIITSILFLSEPLITAYLNPIHLSS